MGATSQSLRGNKMGTWYNGVPSTQQVDSQLEGYLEQCHVRP